jgi:hypothetical protein
MQRNDAKHISIFEGLRQAVTDFGLLVKFKLTLLVLFSAVCPTPLCVRGR